MAEKFAKDVRGAMHNNGSTTLARLFHPLYVDDSLYLAVAAQGNNIEAHVNRILSKDALLASFVSAFLDFVKDGGYVAEEGLLVTLSCKKLEIVLTMARKILNSQQCGWFIPVVRVLATGLVSLAFIADSMTGDPQNPAASSAARSLTSLLNVSAVGEAGPKRRAVLHLANETLRIYFHLKNPRMGNTVVKNTGDAPNRLEEYPKSDQVAFLYYVGRMSLFEKNLRRASDQLETAMDLCTSEAPKNCRLVLVYLTVARLPLGIFPSPQLLQQFDLSAQFCGLIEALKAGYFIKVLQELNLWQQWHLQKGNYLVLREKLEIICWRNLIRQTLWTLEWQGPPGNSKPPAMKLAVLLAAALQFIDPMLDLDDVECMCASLINQGYLKAYIHHASSQIVFQKFAPFGFPPISSVQV